MRKTRRRCDLATVLLTAPATTGGPSQPEATRTQALPGKPAHRPPGSSQGEADRQAQGPRPGRTRERAQINPLCVVWAWYGRFTLAAIVNFLFFVMTTSCWSSFLPDAR